VKKKKKKGRKGEGGDRQDMAGPENEGTGEERQEKEGQGYMQVFSLVIPSFLSYIPSFY
jgi:hypothetical protein